MIETQEITGRTPVPLSKKLNPMWFGNDFEQTLAEAPWYMPDAPQWKRRAFWKGGIGSGGHNSRGRIIVESLHRLDIRGSENWRHLDIGSPVLRYGNRAT
jgi:hypothetical protein